MGFSQFKGVSPIDAYCGLKDTFIQYLELQMNQIRM